MKLKDLIFIQNLALLNINNNQRKYLYNISKIILLISISWLIGYKYRDGKILIQEYYIKTLNNKQQNLNNNIIYLESKLKEYNFILNDGDYYRYLAFKHADVYIDNNVNSKHLKLMTEHAIINKIPLKYFYRLINKESKFNSNALSNKGAKGYMQIIPSTMKSMVERYEDKEYLNKLNQIDQNIVIGSYYLNYLYKKYNRWDLTFAAYNSGSIVDKCKCVPDYKETQNYVKYILNN